MRVLFPLLAWLLLTTFTPRVQRPLRPPPAVSLVRYAPVTLDVTAPGRSRVGALRFLGGWALSSNDYRFGGLSAVHVEGGEVLAFSDSGWKVRFPLPRAARGVVRADIAALPEGPGTVGRKADRDIESMWVEGSTVWLGFERRNAIWRFDRRTFHELSDAEPPLMRRWPKNRGPEAMLRLRDGRFLIFAEGAGAGGDVVLTAGDASLPGTPATQLRYVPPAHYRATDAALLPDGRALVLNRRWTILTGFTARLTIVPLTNLTEGTTLRGQVIAQFQPPVLVDNLEGLSVSQEKGRTILWIASDDNYLPLQRTLLLKFALEE